MSARCEVILLFHYLVWKIESRRVIEIKSFILKKRGTIKKHNNFHRYGYNTRIFTHN